MDERHEEIAQLFIERYNFVKGTHYTFECLRKSMFSIPEHKFAGFEIYQVAFTGGKKRSPILADLMVLLRLQKRLIVEVVEPHVREEDVKRAGWSQLVGAIIDLIETDALGKVVCSKSLLVDGRGFRRIRISDPEIYKRHRLQRNGTLKNINKRELSQASFPPKHWFTEIWLSYHDEEGVIRCLQIW